MTHELVHTDWFDEEALRLPGYKVGRVNFGRGRSYIRINEGGVLESPLRLYTSLTTAINSCAPMEDPLLDWYIKHGRAEANRLLTLAQQYGTLLHLEIGKFLKEQVYDLDTTDAAVEEYTGEHGYWHQECKDWADKLKVDMLAFIQFALDYNIKPLGIEYVLLSDKGFGTLIDLVCKLTIEEQGYWGEVYKSGERKGEPKLTKKPVEKTAIINFKSGRHGFYRSNGIQIECEKQLWEENFPDIHIDMACNWSPKEWTSTPSYNFKDWTGEIDQDEIDAVLMLANVRYASKAENKQYMNISGVVSTPESLLAALGKETIEEYCNRKFSSTPFAPKRRSVPASTYVSAPLPI
ncbi:hypothetical protein [Pedobacter faecalis]|uniref:hypothetical protein n=1 Tax=Pedobacter faecalis TaxID=3041495 RepID=UPI00254E0C46|nr:hypothetical protein [Pedobacter sp. ELA7]